MSGDVVVRISGGKRSTIKYKSIFKANDFSFNERSYGHSFWQKEMSRDEAGSWKNFCRRKRMTCNVYPVEYTRSSGYRKAFLESAKTVRGKYRCAYCGSLIRPEKMQVDHIIPVKRMMDGGSARWIAKCKGINNVNDPKNLCSSCEKCNKKKGSKTGGWVTLGFLGKSELLWKIRKVVRALLVITALYLVYETGILPNNL